MRRWCLRRGVLAVPPAVGLTIGLTVGVPVGSTAATAPLVRTAGAASLGGSSGDDRAPRPGRPVAADWTAELCTRLVDFQAAALDARAALWTSAPVPVDRAGRARAVRDLRVTLAPVRTRLTAIDRTLTGPAPRGREPARAADAIHDAWTRVADAYADADRTVDGLAKAAVQRFPTGVERLRARLDRKLDRATEPLTRVERRVRNTLVGDAFAVEPPCRAVGLEWSSIPAGAEAVTPAPPVVAPEAPGATDLLAPALLLPGRYRPPPEIAALGAQAALTGRGRTHFYAASPSLTAGEAFAASCPSDDPEHVHILGCYRDGRIHVLAVTRPDLAGVVLVTAAHELLHAVYDGLTFGERDRVDAQTSAFFATTTDDRLRSIIAEYDARQANRADELHSLVPTQIATLDPGLHGYYLRYFRDRGAVVAAHQAYVAVFDGLFARYDELRGAIDELAGRITSLQAQAEAAGGEADRLARQIDDLRAQGRFEESNTLVPSQNAAVRRAQGLSAEANRLVDQHNALVDQINAVADELGGLGRALSPLG